MVMSGQCDHFHFALGLSLVLSWFIRSGGNDQVRVVVQQQDAVVSAVSKDMFV